MTSTGHEHKPPTSRFLRGDGYLPAKRFLDVVFAFALLALFGPLMLLIVLAIKLESPGPAIFRQERVGLGEKTFTLLKFRTMRCEEGHDLHREHATRLIRDNVVPANSQETLKLKSDPRITRLGRILRRTSLDELPQFVNVLRGEMSLVGPRPPLPYEVELYQDWHKRRFEVLPGITGLWQVNGRNQVCFAEMVRMDTHYIENLSLWLDLWIILKTPLEMTRGKGAG